MKDTSRCNSAKTASGLSYFNPVSHILFTQLATLSWQ